MYAVLIVDRRGIPGRAVSFEDFEHAQEYLASLCRLHDRPEEEIQAEVYESDQPGIFLDSDADSVLGAWLIQLEDTP